MTQRTLAPAPSDRGGFALIAAIWLVAGFSALALYVGVRARAAALTSANVAEGSRAEAAALGGLEHARARLQQRLNETSPALSVDPWYEIATAFADTIGLSNGVHYTVELRDGGDRLHLNAATEDELRRMLVALRIDAGQADRIAQAIADWRDGDDFSRARGAERVEYLATHAPVLPSNSPFSRVSELRHVAGVTEEVIQLVEPLLTLRGTGIININAAPPEVLLALPGITAEAAHAIQRSQLSNRSIASLTELSELLSPPAREELMRYTPQLQRRISFRTNEIQATATAWMAGSPIRARATGLFVRGGSTAFFVERSVL